MRKLNYLFGVLALGLGVLIGTLGVSAFSNSSGPAAFISKLRGQDKIQTLSGTVNEPAQPSISGSVPTEVPAIGSAPLDSNTPLASSPQSTEPSSAQSTDPSNPKTDTQATNKLNETIVADYKQDIGIFFDAWKSSDMTEFRQKLSKAYTGDLLEKHARRAENYLLQGIGLDVSQITFDRVDVESAGANSATLRVDYRYTASDYSLLDSAPIGDSHEQNVHARVNLIKQNSRWVITGESTV